MKTTFAAKWIATFWLVAVSSLQAAPVLDIAVFPLRNTTGDASLDWIGVALQDSLTVDLWYLSGLNTKGLPDIANEVRKVCPGLELGCVYRMDDSHWQMVASRLEIEEYLQGEYRKTAGGIEVRLVPKENNKIDLLYPARLKPLVFTAPPEKLLATASRALLRWLPSVGVYPDRKRRAAINSPKTGNLDAWKTNAEGYWLQARQIAAADVSVDYPLLGKMKTQQRAKVDAQQNKAEIEKQWLAKLQAAVKSDSRYGEAWNNLGYAHIIINDSGGSLPDPVKAEIRPILVQALAHKPNMPDVLIGLALVGAPEDALKYYEKAVLINPSIAGQFWARHIVQSITSLDEKRKVERLFRINTAANWLISEKTNLSTTARIKLFLELMQRLVDKDQIDAAQIVADKIYLAAPVRRDVDAMGRTIRVQMLLAQHHKNFEQIENIKKDVIRIAPQISSVTSLKNVTKLLVDNSNSFSQAEGKNLAKVIAARFDVIKSGLRPSAQQKQATMLAKSLADSFPEEAEVIFNAGIATAPLDIKIIEEKILFLGLIKKNAAIVEYLESKAEFIGRHATALQVDEFNVIRALACAYSKQTDKAFSIIQPMLAQPHESQKKFMTDILVKIADVENAAKRYEQALSATDALLLLMESNANFTLQKRAGLLALRNEMLKSMGRVDEAKAMEKALRVAEYDALAEYMKSNYLWRDGLEARIRSVRQENGDDLPPLNIALERLLDSANDRWSGAVSSQENAKQERNERFGFGLSFRLLEGNRMKVIDVISGSPADKTGIKRGDIVESIGGIPASELGDHERFGVAMNDDHPDLPISLVIRRGSGLEKFSMMRASYPNEPIQELKIIEHEGQGVGYLHVRHFISMDSERLSKAIYHLSNNGISDLVIDLRHNKGGNAAYAAMLANALVPRSLDGKSIVQFVYGLDPKAQTEKIKLKTLNDTLAMPRLFILTSRDTCSASEFLINGLKPLMGVVSIGEKTCGKPFGMSSSTIGRWRVSPISFKIENGFGQGNYTKGLTPDCAVKDSFDHALGDPRDPLIRTALAFMQKGVCPAVSSDASQ